MSAEDVEWSRYVVCICYLWATRFLFLPNPHVLDLKKEKDIFYL